MTNVREVTLGFTNDDMNKIFDVLSAVGARVLRQDKDIPQEAAMLLAISVMRKLLDDVEKNVKGDTGWTMDETMLDADETKVN